MTLSASQESRVGELDRALDGQNLTSTLADELFSIVDVLTAQPTVRRVLTEPGMAEQARLGFVRQVFGGKVSDSALGVLTQAATLRWGSGGALVEALDRQALRAEFLDALQNGRLDTVEEELFRFGRIVAADRGLREALAERVRSVADRQQLAAGLLDGKADGHTVRLVKRAISAPDRTLALTLERYLELAAAVRKRRVAVVHVATPLDAEQERRLQAALSRKAGHDVSMQVIVDPSVLGGVRVEMGDDLIEGTVSARMQNARRALG